MSAAGKKRERAPRVAQVDLDRIAAFLKKMGATIAEVDLSPGKARIITTDGQGLTLPPEEDELDRELQVFRENRDRRPS